MWWTEDTSSFTRHTSLCHSNLLCWRSGHRISTEPKRIWISVYSIRIGKRKWDHCFFFSLLLLVRRLVVVIIPSISRSFLCVGQTFGSVASILEYNFITNPFITYRTWYRDVYLWIRWYFVFDTVLPGSETETVVAS